MSSVGFDGISTADARVWAIIGGVVGGLLLLCSVVGSIAWQRIFFLRRQSQPSADKRSVLLRVIDGLLLDIAQLNFVLGITFFSLLAPVLCFVWFSRQIWLQISFILSGALLLADRVYDSVRLALHEAAHRILSALRLFVVKTKLYRLYCGCCKHSRCAACDAWCSDPQAVSPNRSSTPLTSTGEAKRNAGPHSPVRGTRSSSRTTQESPRSPVSPSRLGNIEVIGSPRAAAGASASPSRRTPRVADAVAPLPPQAAAHGSSVPSRSLSSITLEALWTIWATDADVTSSSAGLGPSNNSERQRLRRNARGDWEEEVSDEDEGHSGFRDSGFREGASPPPPSAPLRTASTASHTSSTRQQPPPPSAPTISTASLYRTGAPRPSAPLASRLQTAASEPASVGSRALSEVTAATEPRSVCNGTDPGRPMWPDDPEYYETERAGPPPSAPPSEASMRAIQHLRR
jgi:hypothetical protein